MDFTRFILTIITGLILSFGWGVTVESVGFFRFATTWVIGLSVMEILPIYMDKWKKR